MMFIIARWRFESMLLGPSKEVTTYLLTIPKVNDIAEFNNSEFGAKKIQEFLSSAT
jgi:hypothetical protein